MITYQGINKLTENCEKVYTDAFKNSKNTRQDLYVKQQTRDNHNFAKIELDGTVYVKFPVTLNKEIQCSYTVHKIIPTVLLQIVSQVDTHCLLI